MLDVSKKSTKGNKLKQCPDLEKHISEDDSGANYSDSHQLVERVVIKYGPLLRTYFYNRMRSYDEIDDYLQELYCRVLVYKHPSEIKSIQKFVFTIAVNLMRDRSRRVNTRMKKTTISIDEADERDSGLVDYESPIRAIKGLQAIITAEKIVNNFPVNCKKAFILHRIEGYTQKEIAETLGVTVSAVEKYMMMAKKRLHTEIDTNFD